VPAPGSAVPPTLCDLLFDGASVGLCLLDPAGKVLRANAAWLRTTGFSLEEVLGADALSLFPETRDLGGELHRRARAGEHVEVPRHVQHIEGHETWWEGSVDPVSMEGGVGLLIVAREVTGLVERARADEALQEANERLKEADGRKDEFLAVLSHELRNPLAPIRNSLHILDHADPGGPQARHAREVASRQVALLSRLVDDLLEATRWTRGKVQLQRGVVDLAVLARRTAEDHRGILERRGLDFVVEVPAAPLLVDADEARLVQAIGNLLRNAAKFTAEGGRVTLAVTEEGRQALVRVQDTGVGIDPGVIASVFDPFVQEERTRERTDGGIGLGLALVRSIVELHGGEVRAESGGRGQGATFTIRLPLRQAAAEQGPRAGAGVPRVAGPRRVLVVDDNVDSAESLADLLRLHGHRVEIAFDGTAALVKLESTCPDTVLCDIGMPGMTGYDVARAIRARGLPGVQLIALSGHAQGEDVQRALEAGFDAHVAKPPDPEKLAFLIS
jgi:PAS domain S-box-containing protein